MKKRTSKSMHMAVNVLEQEEFIICQITVEILL